MVTNKTANALREVVAERVAQDGRWGVQNHPDRALLALDVWSFHHGMDAADWKARNATRASRGELAWDGILLEEVFEACAETDPVKIREELVQVAAVAVAWIEALDRRAAGAL